MPSDAFQESSGREMAESTIFARDQNANACLLFSLGIPRGYTNQTNIYQRVVEWYWNYEGTDSDGFLRSISYRQYKGTTYSETFPRTIPPGSPGESVVVSLTHISTTTYRLVHVIDGIVYPFAPSALGIGGFSPQIHEPGIGMAYGWWYLNVYVTPKVQLGGHVEILIVRGGRTGAGAFDEYIAEDGSLVAFPGFYTADPDIGSKRTFLFTSLNVDIEQSASMFFQGPEDFCNQKLVAIIRDPVVPDYAALIAGNPIIDTEALHIRFNAVRYERFTVFFIFNTTGTTFITGYINPANGTGVVNNPHVFQFTDTTIANNGKSAWSWDFGDGQSSALQNPQHTYANIGTYNVTLAVTDANGFPETGTIPVTVQPYVDAQFTYTVTPIGASRNIHFTNTRAILPPSLEASATYLWNFGAPAFPPNTSTLENPPDKLLVTGLGSVVVTLTVTAGGVVSVYSQTISLA